MAADPLTDPQTARLDRRVTWSVIALVAATVLVGALVPGAPRHAALAPAQDPACAEWGDGCKVCRRTEDGAACSLPGIACTPGAMACLRAAGEL
ncbi:hypothetical protein MPAR168_19875 [Methylorubrum populi]|uniref:Uncharacterized protein n=1 Tax=Methylobacterium radiotolerans TaxID=31998 RepID=A0ABU7T5C8_9HYPH